MSRPAVLSVAFLQAQNVVVPKELRDWMTRVSFLARSQADPAKRERYEKWALCTIEDAAAAPHGVAGVRWAKQSTIMPHDAPARTPKWWPAAAPSPQPGSSARSALLEETLRRAPGELEAFVHQGFGLYDREVARGQRTYEQVTFVEMLNIAMSLQAKAPKAPVAPAPPRQPTPPLKAAVSQSYPPPYVAPSASPAPPHASTRAAPSYKRSPPPNLDEPPVKKHTASATAGAAYVRAPAERKYVFELGGVHEADAAAAPAFVGQSTALERAYTRYEPLVEDIRPLPVLQEAYAYIVRRSGEVTVAENIKAGRKYLSDQLKGLRQDLRVQNIVNDFTVFVYETHARLCLATGDIGEFNQCQASLKHFYTSPAVDLHHCHPREFFHYRLVYLTLSEQYDSLSTELITVTNAQITGTARPGTEVSKNAVRDTLMLCNACMNGDTTTICTLLQGFQAEMMCLVRIYLPKLRIMWLREILTAMKGSLTMRFLLASLGFTGIMVKATPKQPAPVWFWLDGTLAEAEARLVDMFATLKLALPTGFLFATEVQRTKHNKQPRGSSNSVLDASVALKAVEEHLVYLGTRSDATRSQ